MLLTYAVAIVLVCAALGVLAWSIVSGAVFVRNVAAIAGLTWEAITAIPAVVRVARRRLTGARRP